MRLQSALSMDEFQGIEDDDFGRLSREEREERRDERRARQRRRKRKQRKRKTARMKRRRNTEEPNRDRRGGGRRRRGGSGSSRPRKAERRGGPQRSMVPAQRYDQGSSSPYQEASLEPASWGPEAVEPEIIDADFEDDYQQFLDLEMGAARRRRWSPKVQMGPNFRLQAAQGYRAAVIELKPGLFIVAEVPDHVARSEFGILPLLAPLVVSAASRAIAKPPEQRVLPKLLKVVREGKQAQGGGGGQGRALLQRMFQKKAATSAPKQIPMQAAPVQAQPQRRLVPVAGAGRGQSALMPAPMLGRWVDEDDLAGLFGCDEHGNCDCGG